MAQELATCQVRDAKSRARNSNVNHLTAGKALRWSDELKSFRARRENRLPTALEDGQEDRTLLLALRHVVRDDVCQAEDATRRHEYARRTQT